MENEKKELCFKINVGKELSVRVLVKDNKKYNAKLYYSLFNQNYLRLYLNKTLDPLQAIKFFVDSINFYDKF